MNGQQAGNSRALRKLMAHEMSRALGRDHEHVDVLGRLDESEVDREAVRQREIFSGAHGGRDFGVVNSRRQFVGSEDHDDVGFFRGLAHGHHAQSGFLRFGDRCAGALQADNHVAARVRQIHGVGMALRSKTDHGNFLVFDVVQIRVFIVVNLHISSCCVSWLAISFNGTCSYRAFRCSACALL